MAIFSQGKGLRPGPGAEGQGQKGLGGDTGGQTHSGSPWGATDLRAAGGGQATWA